MFEPIKQNGGLINSAVVKLGFVKEADLVQLLSRQYSLPVVQVEGQVIEAQVLSLIPQHLAQKHLVVPLEVNNGTLTLAMVDPSNIVALNDIGYRGPLSVEWEDSRMDREHGATEAAAFVKRIDFAPSAIAFDAQFDR